ncbi:hypothetical protein H5410_032882 [Solanum commersonii]|uniref:Uncharacterized protein n=1 Tax=Solanum commersonii TaxID=4109 RepID=A0A9J5YP63_SOLCO|nr:hypothetical protein H5410_032882 [Solanum commersonii]
MIFISVPQRCPCNQLIDSATKSPNINVWTIVIVTHQFRCHIPFCSPDHQFPFFFHGLFKSHGKPEIINLGSFFCAHQENIVRLDVAVNNSISVNATEA